MSNTTYPQQAQFNDLNQAAIAPYNFVPLPTRIVPAQDVDPIEQVPSDNETYTSSALVRQDQYHIKRKTGMITCTLTTETPLYIRALQSATDYGETQGKSFHALSDNQKERYAEPFSYGDAQSPIIPGSSIRGMLRALVEIASYAKVERIFDRQLFYRSVQDQHYTDHFTEMIHGVRVAPNPSATAYHSLVKTGYLEKEHGKWVIRECTYARIDTNPKNSQLLATVPALDGVPYHIHDGITPPFQHQRIYVAIDADEKDYFYQEQWSNDRIRHPDMYLRFRGVQQASWIPASGLQEGYLVLTGFMQHKHLQFVFLNDTITTHSLSSDMKERFEADDQITQWQETAFPAGHGRSKDGGLRQGEPVFFLLNPDNTVRFFGRAQLFRLPYRTTPLGFVSDELRFGTGRTADAPVIDIAEALFGAVRQQRSTNVQTIAGRINVSDAHYISAKDSILLSNRWFHPRILASPKPTTYQHYLVQNRLDHPLNRYDSSKKRTLIRGYKLYWHQDQRGQVDIEEQDTQKVHNAVKQYTGIRPVNSGVSFEFSIHFENLSDVELGALLWVLHIASDSRYRLKIGMGKPLGMGAIKIESTIMLNDRKRRYEKLFDGQGWMSGNDKVLSLEAFEEQEKCISAFDKYIMQILHGAATQHTLLSEPRIQCLLTLLRWPGPPHEKTRYMEIERDATDRHNVLAAARQNNSRRKQLPNGRSILVINEYGGRPVLPLPTQIYPIVNDNDFQLGYEQGVVSLTTQTASEESIGFVPSISVVTVEAEVIGVGANDAGIKFIYQGQIKHGRASFSDGLPRKVTSRDRVVVQLEEAGQPNQIIAFL